MREVVSRSAYDVLLVTRPSNLHYLLGLSTSAGAALVHRAGMDFLVDGRYLDAAMDAVRELPSVTVVAVPSGQSYEETFAARTMNGAWATVAVEASHMTLGRLAALQRSVPHPGQLQWLEAEDEVERLRAVKDPWELGILRVAGAKLAEVATCILPQVSAGRTEREVAWTIAVALHDAGFERPAFESIVASGPNGARPHHRPTERRLEKGDLVVVDFGGVLGGYAVDMTRTVNLGAPPARQGWIEAVQRAQAAAFEACRPGNQPSTVDAAARRVLDDAGLGGYFTHSTGHGLGLNIHERPTIGPRGDSTGPLVSGMVFTVEPGVYVPGEGGVRIEDDVILTETGAEWLTRAKSDNDLS